MQRKQPLNFLPPHDRPRERLLIKGPMSLTTIELLAIIVGSGNKKNDVLQIAKSISTKFPNLNSLLKVNVNDLREISGIGDVKATQIVACFELARRLSGEENVLGTSIKTSNDIYNILKPIFLGKMVESFFVICLNARRKVISIRNVSVGTINQTIVHPREVFIEAISSHSSYLVVAHNHPSGDHEPSEDDIAITQKLLEVSKTIGIPLIDHLIVSDSGFTSFHETGLLN